MTTPTLAAAWDEVHAANQEAHARRAGEEDWVSDPRTSRRSVRTIVMDTPELRAKAGIRPDRLPAFQGEGDSDYACGACGEVIAEAVQVGQFQALGFHCPCGRYSEPPVERRRLHR